MNIFSNCLSNFRKSYQIFLNKDHASMITIRQFEINFSAPNSYINPERKVCNSVIWGQYILLLAGSK